MIELLFPIWNYIEYIAGIINNVTIVLSTLLTVSTWFGKLIVDFLGKCFIGVYTLLCSIINVITIMCEDFIFFLSDLENIYANLASLFSSVCDNSSYFFKYCLDNLCSVIYYVIYVRDSICGAYRDGMKAIYDFLVTLKGAIILIGNVIWTGVTLIPAIFIYFISILVFFIHKSVEEIITITSSVFYLIITFCSETFLFVIDTPVESVCGLLIGLVLVYFTHKHKITIFTLAAEYFYQLSKNVQTILLESLVFIVNIIYSCILKLHYAFNYLKQTVKCHIKKNDSVSETNCPSERLCVVCKDSESNVVAIPCKHMCLCEACSNYDVFRHPQTTCPICRQHIDRLLKVYL